LIPRVYRGLRFVAISKSTAEDLASRGLPIERTDVVSPGLDLARYHVDAAVPKSTEPLLVYLGMLKRYKGIDAVIRAVARARQTVAGIRFVLMGKGTDRPRLEALAHSLGIGDAVIFAGWVSEDEKIAWLRRALALVYPSCKEGWGIPTMEAAACATPTLASDVEGLRDAVRDQETGFLLPHLDVDAWARALIKILSDAPLRARLGAAAQAWARKFSWDAQAAQMCAVVEEVAAQGVDSTAPLPARPNAHPPERPAAKTFRPRLPLPARFAPGPPGLDPPPVSPPPRPPPSNLPAPSGKGPPANRGSIADHSPHPPPRTPSPA